MIKSRYTASITDKPWWLAGGIPADKVIAAYQPVGAQSLAASYLNLAKPGTYTIKKYGDDIAFSPVTGWQFVKANTDYLLTGIVPVLSQYSYLVRYSDAVDVGNSSGNVMFGARDGLSGTNLVGWGTYHFGDRAIGWNGTTAGQILFVPPNLASGVGAIAGTRVYKDGVYYGACGASGDAFSLQIAIGGINHTAAGSDTLDWTMASAKIQAFVAYSTILTDIQIATITRAMNAL